MKITKRAVAKYFGVSEMTITNYQQGAKDGNEEYQRRLDAYYDFYTRQELKNQSRVKTLKDINDGQTYYLLQD